MTEKRLPFESIIAHHFPINRGEAFELMAGGKSSTSCIDVGDVDYEVI